MSVVILSRNFHSMATGDTHEFKKQQIAKFLKENKDAALNQIFDFIPRTTIAIDTGLHKSRIGAKVENPNLFRVSEILAIAEYLNLPPERIFQLILASMPAKQAKR